MGGSLEGEDSLLAKSEKRDQEMGEPKGKVHKQPMKVPGEDVSLGGPPSMAKLFAA
jgi:hypothetical protein